MPTQPLALLRNLPVTLSVVARHLGRDPLKMVSVGLRVLPSGARLAVARVAARLGLPVVAAVAYAAAGRSREARALLARVTDAGSVAARARAATAGAVLHYGPEATAALASLPEGAADRDRVAALVLADTGHLEEAHAAARRWAERSRRGQARRLERALGAELSVLHADLVVRTRGLPRGPASGTAGKVARRPAGRHTGADRAPGVRRVLHVVTNSLPEVQAGYTLRTRGITTAQLAAGLDPHVVTRLGFPVDAGFLGASRSATVAGVPHHRLLPARWLPTLPDELLGRHADELTRLVERLRPDVLHAHSRHLNAQVALAAGARTGTPVVYEVRGFLEETWRTAGGAAESDHYRLSREAETRCMAAADAVVTLSGPMRDDIVARGIDPALVHVVGNCVDEEFLETPAGLTTRGAGVRSRLGLPAEGLVVGVVSTLNEYEGVAVVVDALAELARPDLSLLVVGDGPARAALEERAGALGVRAVFTGRVPHAVVRDHYEAVDVVAVPRLATPVTVLVPPLKPLEAMASARALVASDLPPLHDIVTADVTGDLVPPGDVAAWAAALAGLADDAERRARLGAAARSWVVDHRTWGHAAEQLNAVYEGVLGHSGSAIGLAYSRDAHSSTPPPRGPSWRQHD